MRECTNDFGEITCKLKVVLSSFPENIGHSLNRSLITFFISKVANLES